jgi:hypothetical protein
VVGDNDVKVIDRFLTPIKINLVDFYPIEYTEVVYIISHTAANVEKVNDLLYLVGHELFDLLLP